jgi:hypothetical protein
MATPLYPSAQHRLNPGGRQQIAPVMRFENMAGGFNADQRDSLRTGQVLSR